MFLKIFLILEIIIIILDIADVPKRIQRMGRERITVLKMFPIDSGVTQNIHYRAEILFGNEHIWGIITKEQYENYFKKGEQFSDTFKNLKNNIVSFYC